MNDPEIVDYKKTKAELEALIATFQEPKDDCERLYQKSVRQSLVVNNLLETVVWYREQLEKTRQELNALRWRNIEPVGQA